MRLSVAETPPKFLHTSFIFKHSFIAVSKSKSLYLPPNKPKSIIAVDDCNKFSISKDIDHLYYKTLNKAKLVTSIRGSQGGYSLAKKSSTISAAEIIDAFEGPVAITECSASYHSCSLESQCGVGEAWQKINRAIRNTLENISLTDLRSGQNRKTSIKFSGIPINIKAH